MTGRAEGPGIFKFIPTPELLRFYMVYRKVLAHFLSLSLSYPAPFTDHLAIGTMFSPVLRVVPLGFVSHFARPDYTVTFFALEPVAVLVHAVSLDHPIGKATKTTGEQFSIIHASYSINRKPHQERLSWIAGASPLADPLLIGPNNRLYCFDP